MSKPASSAIFVINQLDGVELDVRHRVQQRRAAFVRERRARFDGARIDQFGSGGTAGQRPVGLQRGLGFQEARLGMHQLGVMLRVQGPCRGRLGGGVGKLQGLQRGRSKFHP